MPEIRTNIDNCTRCEDFKSTPIPTMDSWERPEEWFCKNKNKKIRGYVDLGEHVPVPDWCPRLINPKE